MPLFDFRKFLSQNYPKICTPISLERVAIDKEFIWQKKPFRKQKK